jgi:hypothetical protein
MTCEEANHTPQQTASMHVSICNQKTDHGRRANQLNIPSKLRKDKRVFAPQVNENKNAYLPSASA